MKFRTTEDKRLFDIWPNKWKKYLINENERGYTINTGSGLIFAQTISDATFILGLKYYGISGEGKWSTDLYSA